MTEKELLYVEDAIEHEKAIIKICNESINNLSSNDLKDFFNEQIKSHSDMKSKLITLLKEKANEG